VNLAVIDNYASKSPETPTEPMYAVDRGGIACGMGEDP
jgi:hypothetical protein